MAQEDYGSASITPTANVRVGTFHTWTITYTVGDIGMDDGGRIKIAWNMTSDWGTPQFEDPTADNYATADTSGGANLSLSFDKQGHIRPWKHTIVIDVFDGSLDKGDTITLVLGATDGGGMGHHAQTFPEEDFRIAILVDPFGTGDLVKLKEDLTFDVVPGPAYSIDAVVPSTVNRNDELPVNVRVEDYWGNPACFDEQLVVETEEVTTTTTATDGLASTSIPLDGPGVYRVIVRTADGRLETTSNPVVYGQDTGRGVYWGDLHGQSGETVGTGTIDDYFRFARDAAFLDFASHAGNDFQITDSFWDEIQSTIQELHSPGEFVTFLCYEWSGNTSRGGDHNVYFKHDQAEIHRSSHWQTEDEYEKHRGIHSADELYDLYENRKDVLLIPHLGGRPATLDAYNPDLTPFVEVISVWGVFEWFGQEALNRGYYVGFVGGSDDHTGRPGASRPTNHSEFNIDGGLMAAKAKSLSREDLWQSFKRRHVYATTGARILLGTTVNGTLMGGVTSAEDNPEMKVQVNGTDAVQQIDLYCGPDRIATKDYADGDELIEIIWSGERARTRNKVQNWSGGLTLSQGQIDRVEEFGFDHPEQGIIHETPTGLQWDGSSSGNYQGIRLGVNGEADGTMTISTVPISTTVAMENLEKEMIKGEQRNQTLQIRRIGIPDQPDVATSFTLTRPDTGVNPYYVRVRQYDGEMAWSSPIYIEAK